MITLDSLRLPRIGPYAIFDLVLSFVGVAMLSPLLSWIFRQIHLRIPFISWMYFTLPIGIISHILVGNHTLMTKQFLDPQSHYLLKIFIFVLIILGCLNIKIIK